MRPVGANVGRWCTLGWRDEPCVSHLGATLPVTKANISVGQHLHIRLNYRKMELNFIAKIPKLIFLRPPGLVQFSEVRDRPIDFHYSRSVVWRHRGG